MEKTLLLATRNSHKLEEIRGLLHGIDVEIVTLSEAGVEPHPEEESIEVFETFEGNALAKVRYYRKLTGLPVIADDSGLCVDALDGGPGVHSRRFAPTESRRERPGDVANNAWLLECLREVPAALRGAHYRCALAMVDDARSLVVNGTVHGRIADRERGRNGFGYDPLFVLAGGELTFGELPPTVKAERSHRADAIRRLRPWLV